MLCSAVTVDEHRRQGSGLKERVKRKTEDGETIMKSHVAICKCDAKGMKDGKCGCGKEVKTMSCKGMYVCPMGCEEVSDKPGKCACGMEMKKSE